MNDKKGKTKEIDDFIDEADAVSATEMTGLMATMPETNEEKRNYSQVFHYKAKAKKKK